MAFPTHKIKYVNGEISYIVQQADPSGVLISPTIITKVGDPGFADLLSSLTCCDGPLAGPLGDPLSCMVCCDGITYKKKYTEASDGTETLIGFFGPDGLEVDLTGKEIVYGECKSCDPMWGQFNGDEIPSPLPSYNSILITKPACCELTVTSDAGTLTIPTELTMYSVCFGCLLTTLELETSGCELSEVKVILQREN